MSVKSWRDGQTGRFLLLLPKMLDFAAVISQNLQCLFFLCGKLLDLVKLQAQDSAFKLLPVNTQM